VSHWHHLTVDVEEYFHPTALEDWVPRNSWEALPRRSPRLVEWILEHLASVDAKGTFFILGWLAEREPGLVKAIADAGHEIASHGWDHRRVFTLPPEEFRADIQRSRSILRELSGQEVTGYRAPSFSILPGIEWALDILIEEGFAYDSSLFPVRLHPGYGYPEAPVDPHRIDREGGGIWEVPPATLRLGRTQLPAGGGAYLRFFPVYLVQQAIMSAEERGAPATLYLHPWELDVDMPRIDAPFRTRLRMTGGIRRVKGRLARLTSEFRFRPIRDTLTALQAGAKLDNST